MNALIFLDLRSAFDSICWNKLFHKLASQKFPLDLITSIQIIYHSTSISINRYLNPINIKKGTP